jgi:UDP-glucose 4-epimerase
MVTAFAKASERDIPVKIAPRCAGDVAAMQANADHAKSELDW